MEARLDGRTAVITGGSEGIGLAIATRFAASGANVAILARRPEVLAKACATITATARGKVTTATCDVSKGDDIQRAYGKIMDTFGRVDILVNNAGGSRSGPFLDVSDELWQEDIDVKLFGAIRLTRLVWPQMVERRWGRVLNILATLAKTPRKESAPTSVTRAAGMALTKVLANEGAPHNILVNGLLIGSIKSMRWESRAKRANVPLETFFENRGKSVPLGRLGEPEEAANLACFLASEQGSYITGTAINVDGGLSPAV